MPVESYYSSKVEGAHFCSGKAASRIASETLAMTSLPNVYSILIMLLIETKSCTGAKTSIGGAYSSIQGAAAPLKRYKPQCIAVRASLHYPARPSPLTELPAGGPGKASLSQAGQSLSGNNMLERMLGARRSPTRISSPTLFSNLCTSCWQSGSLCG